MKMGETTMLATHRKHWSQAKKKGKCKIPSQTDIQKESKYFFYKKNGHMKKDCIKFKNWLDKKDKLISCICYKSNMANVVYNI